jgi:hypothetical protein
MPPKRKNDDTVQNILQSRRQKRQARDNAIPLEDDMKMLRDVVASEHSGYATCWASLNFWLDEDALPEDFQNLGVPETRMENAIRRVKHKKNWETFDCPEELRNVTPCAFCKPL